MKRLSDAQLRQQGNREANGQYKQAVVTGGMSQSVAGFEDPFTQPVPPVAACPENVHRNVPVKAGDAYAHYNGEESRYAACSGIDPILLTRMPGMSDDGGAPVLVGWTDDGPHNENYVDRNGHFHLGPATEDVYLIAPVYAESDGTVTIPLPGASDWGTIPAVAATDGTTDRVRARAYPNGVVQWLGPQGEYLDDPGSVVMETIGTVGDNHVHNYRIDDDCDPEVRFTPVREEDRVPGGPVGALTISWYTRDPNH